MSATFVAGGADRPSVRRCGESRMRGYGRCAGRRKHFTHSKVMAWVALDRAIKHHDALMAAAAI